jgi:hypothetical protein
MLNSLNLFENNIKDSAQLLALFEFSSKHLPGMVFDDLLRAHLVYSVSAFDKLIHDIIKIGMVEIFTNNRQATPKYLNERISLEIHNKISVATIPPREYFFENEVVRKLSFLSFQDPDKVAEGLSFIWAEPHKWHHIAANMGVDQHTTKTTLKTIVARRNQIVHEADIDIATGQKYLIDKTETETACNFVLSCGQAIYSQVRI